MARLFNYYDDWRLEILECSCGWKGTFDEGWVELHDEVDGFVVPTVSGGADARHRELSHD